MMCLKIFARFLVVMFWVLSTTHCNAQTSTNNDKQQDAVDRKPVVAGSFYPDKPESLQVMLESLFARSEKVKTHDDVLAIISPHAGYSYSGKVAASAFNQIDPDKSYDNIFILAPSHRVMFGGASMYAVGDYITPLGKVKVNRQLINELIGKHKIFKYHPEAHQLEHSIEVQLPFLQYSMHKEFRIVPIVIGTQNQDDCKKIAAALKPYFTEDNLWIISTDFSHYPDYEHALKVDQRTGDAIVANSVNRVIDAIRENESANINNLVTSMCGWNAVLSVLHITQNMPDINVIHIDYQNSGDETGDKSRVVGYHAIAFTKKKKQPMPENQFKLSEEEQEKLLRIARNSINDYLASGKIPEIENKDITPAMKEPCGAFVTLHLAGALRGCIGRFSASEPLYEIVQKMAVAAATEDPRFRAVEPDEMEKIDLEISVLTPLKKIETIDEIEMGRHGIYIKKGPATGTFLPQVARETGWTKEEFLGYCARNKAHLGWDGWKDAEIFIYEALVFSEK
ncbi:MAG: AmmeMemoRadiSam system protein B [Bacteroidales bacterium]|jgi:AmmeMemoRadiSam system protein B/AmmeMemoRadiSam system protein A|nr:AmmeMemoRadiSam system protein B [Bacteroidales bacterium]